MPFLALGLRTGVKYICIRSEFSPERSNMIKLYGELAEHPIWVAVQYSEVSGNIAFKLLILRRILLIAFEEVRGSGIFFT